MNRLGKRTRNSCLGSYPPLDYDWVLLPPGSGLWRTGGWALMTRKQMSYSEPGVRPISCGPSCHQHEEVQRLCICLMDGAARGVWWVVSPHWDIQAPLTHKLLGRHSITASLDPWVLSVSPTALSPDGPYLGFTEQYFKRWKSSLTKTESVLPGSSARVCIDLKWTPSRRHSKSCPCLTLLYHFSFFLRNIRQRSDEEWKP